jgi:hypothetical protein
MSENLVGTVVILAGMSGIFLSRMTPLRAVTTFVVIAATVALWVDAAGADARRGHHGLSGHDPCFRWA